MEKGRNGSKLPHSPDGEGGLRKSLKEWILLTENSLGETIQIHNLKGNGEKLRDG